MTNYDSLLNRVERLAKHIGRTDEIVARLQQQEYELRHARDGSVRELQQVKADRDETEAKRKALHQAVTEMVTELNEAAAKYWPDHDPGTITIATFMGEIERLRAEMETLKGAMAADDKRLLDAEEKVWPGLSYGCDAPEKMADEILYLRNQFANSQRELSEQGLVHGVELQRETADVRQQLDAALADIETLRKQLAAAQRALTRKFQRAVEQLAERKAGTTEPAPVAEPVFCPESERLQAFVAKGWGARDNYKWPDELDAGTIQPTPVAEPAPEIERLREKLDHLERFARVVTDAYSSATPANCMTLLRSAIAHLDCEPAPVAQPLEPDTRGEELQRLRRFVGGVEGALGAFQSISPDTCCDQIARCLSELEDSPAPVAEPAPCPDWRAALSEMTWALLSPPPVTETIDAEGGA